MVHYFFLSCPTNYVLSNFHSRASIQSTNINCTTMEFTASDPPMNGAVMVMIDSATVSNNSVQYNYTPNPEFFSVTPANTIVG